ncbi:hypothetical protein ACN38_g8530 [Penicillium nordicum]|uniref:Integrase catalytic domain-containing protein n=1 Tax=Penicillium nordicum TaxID=229535 RepID=A0A0M9WDG5_9EURO|nr:hypothetical protein ACN38_g8530 [Penicillium nordicum]
MWGAGVTLWHGVFKLLQVDLFFTTADHPQADGQSECTNQTLEIAIRHWAAQQRRTETEHAHIDQPVPATSRWDEALPFLQAILNSSTNVSTGHSPHKLMYGVELRQPSHMLPNLTQIDEMSRDDELTM